MPTRPLLKFFIILSLLMLALPALSQPPSPSPTPTAVITDRISELKAKLDEVQRRLDEAPTGVPLSSKALNPNAAPNYLDSLQRYDVNLRRLITLEQGRSRLQLELDDVSQKVQQVATHGLEEAKPYSVTLLDDLQSQLDTTQDKINSAQLSNAAAKTVEEMEEDRLQKLQALRRRLLEKLSGAPNEIELKRQLENTAVAIEAAESGLQLAQAERKTSKLELEIANKKKEYLQLKLQIVQESFRFSVSTLQSALDRLESDRKDVTKKLKAFKEAEDVSLERLHQILEDEIEDVNQETEISARQEWVTTHRRKRRLLEEKLEYILSRRDLWEHRYLVHQAKAVGNYDEWAESTRGLLNRVNKSHGVLDSELTQIRALLSELLDTKDNPEEELDKWGEIEIQALVNRQKAIEDLLTHHKGTVSLSKRLLAEFSLHKEQESVTEHLGDAWRGLVRFWNIELYTIGDSSVTVGKLCISLTILIVGLSVVGRTSRFLSRRFLGVLPIRENVRVNLERLMRYLMILLVFLFSLHVVNIPLTIFTFLGGTLAIAVGFGAQNILNNFISGLILMVERPVRAGDLIEVDDTLGVVEEIGARSTRVRIPTGIHVILPNSKLLENRVINWTLEDNRIRTQVSVGAAYGCSPERVIKLISEATKNVDTVLNNPAPIVNFDEFGDSSLNFTVHFWVSVATPMDRDRVETTVRINIFNLFEENDIPIPFPQRDVNFNAPVEVRLLKEESEEE